MKNYLKHKVDPTDKKLISSIDELSLWSAPFGLNLLDTIKMNKNMKVLDVGCGLGFPCIEIAQRLGESSFIYGIDPWKEAVERAEFKINQHQLKNIKIIQGYAEELPFENSYFDLIVSNNGINNVDDLNKTLNECRRVSKKNAQLTFSMNLEDSMIEFYSILKEELMKRNDKEALERMKNQIYHKRKPLQEIKTLLNKNGFNIEKIYEDKFYLRFLDGISMFNHPLIKNWFLPGWKGIINQEHLEKIFDSVENKLNIISEKESEFRLSIPFITTDCTAV
jgi:arsenite methyltransferase